MPAPADILTDKEESLCFTVWQEELSGAVTVFRQGCFSSVPSLRRTPACSSTCRDNITTIQDVRDDSQLLFCCCNTNNCNQHFQWERPASSEGGLSIIQLSTIQTFTETQQVRSQSGEPSGSRLSVLYTVLLLVCIFCIFLVAALTIAILIHHIRTKSPSSCWTFISDFSLEMSDTC